MADEAPPSERVLAFAKLTLSLRIVGMREDGYHLLDAEMVTVDLADVLVFSPGDSLEVVDGVTGTAPSGAGATAPAAAAGVPTGDDNLVRRALRAVGRRARVRLEKRIPAGAGLGGGSADAAAVLRWAGVVGASADDLAMAARLGSDVPFSLVGGRARVTGAGEALEVLPFEDRVFTILTPPFGVSTAAAYRAWDGLGSRARGGTGGNDLEAAALSIEPRLRRWRERLREATGREPALAGSGSTWFVEGAFPGGDRIVVHTARP
ncbi:MAG TPA: 4-(cytidine 5'-diphospho)-2-C-methyl-D-erythritol kinase [Acidimicrobiales bacterium]|nr:4-(cytidine 5'-diphospho)-2-C-methyl-D-erythritol kinase [Acidimicrobiales bacterium]